ncbi:MAG: TfuA-related McrA-glycine thioamidation protein [Methanolobus sp.]|uniref:TfuA-related McrA-glycine thioamidation protein n=1 Tax=Methanolobus sp. TaxID=1874737 RepID=UPI0027305065|nr:TfuA-related McrA-glycine thioamidation protein [Methanolobus sp.]MDP2215817.1 TfuA-related McrA-glycine thioamidation protein [Methanolobus sp.]
MSAKKSKALVFTGTSISHADASKILDVDYQPPVFRGSMETAVMAGYILIGIIDGIFFSRAAVAHKEIIRAIDAGVTVVGGCSMGALRASELDVHGMIGVGKIYEWYRDGIVEDDDEVAVATNPDTFEPVSSPMVNMRETLFAAAHKKIIDEESCAALVALAKKTHYTERSYFGLTKEASMMKIISEDKAAELLDYCRNHEADIKRQDAVLVLEKMRELLLKSNMK